MIKTMKNFTWIKVVMLSKTGLGYLKCSVVRIFKGQVLQTKHAACLCNLYVKKFCCCIPKFLKLFLYCPRF